MTTYRTISIALFSFYLSACSSLTVNHDYNQQTDFSKFKSYDWLPFAESMKVDEFNRARFVSAVENNLDSKGLIHNSTKPDLKIAVHFGKQRKVEITNWGYSYAPNKYYTGYGYRHNHATDYINTGGVSVYEYEQGTLILDFIDTNSNQLIWRATAKAIISPASTPEKQTKKVNDAVNTILEDFPPKN